MDPGYFTKCLLFSSHGHTRPFVKQLFLVGTFIRIVMTKFKYVPMYCPRYELSF